eukprot:3463214-Pyramimonas_sp.AAC.1
MIELPVPPRHVHSFVETSVSPAKEQKPDSSTSSGDIFQSPPTMHGPSTLSTTALAAAKSFAFLPWWPMLGNRYILTKWRVGHPGVSSCTCCTRCPHNLMPVRINTRG